MDPWVSVINQASSLCENFMGFASKLVLTFPHISCVLRSHMNVFTKNNTDNGAKKETKSKKEKHTHCSRALSWEHRKKKRKKETKSEKRK
jgi:hypothetical protein